MASSGRDWPPRPAAELERRIRENRARRTRPAVARRLGKSLGLAPQRIRFASLDLTERLLERLRSEQLLNPAILEGSKHATIIRSASRGQLDAALPAIGSALGEKQLILLPDEAKTTGGIEVTAGQLISHLGGMLSLDDRDVVAVAEDLSAGFVVEYFHDATADRLEAVYRLMVWHL